MFFGLSTFVVSTPHFWANGSVTSFFAHNNKGIAYKIHTAQFSSLYSQANTVFDKITPHIAVQQCIMQAHTHTQSLRGFYTEDTRAPSCYYC